MIFSRMLQMTKRLQLESCGSRSKKYLNALTLCMVRLETPRAGVSKKNRVLINLDDNSLAMQL